MAPPARQRDLCRPEAGFQWKPPPPRTPLPLPAPPRVDKSAPASSSAVDDKHNQDIGRPPADKFAALKAYRRARGLCDKCAERWRPGHQCAPTVHLHVVQELMDLLAMPSEAAETSQPAAELSDEHDISGSDGQLFVALSTAAFAGTDGPRTMRFFGSI